MREALAPWGRILFCSLGLARRRIGSVSLTAYGARHPGDSPSLIRTGLPERECCFAGCPPRCRLRLQRGHCLPWVTGRRTTSTVRISAQEVARHVLPARQAAAVHGRHVWLKGVPQVLRGTRARCGPTAQRERRTRVLGIGACIRCPATPRCHRSGRSPTSGRSGKAVVGPPRRLEASGLGLRAALDRPGNAATRFLSLELRPSLRRISVRDRRDDGFQGDAA
jgi:hypothetical protein